MAKFCKHCYELPGELEGTPAGSVKEVGGVASYVTQSGSGKGTIIFATDIYGLGIKNPKIVADNLAKESGFQVVVPDYFEGEPMKVEDFVFPKSTEQGTPSDEQMQQNMSNMTAWVQKGHSPNETIPITKKVIDAVKGDGPVGIVGACYGARVAASLAQEGAVKSAALYHPAMLEADEAKNVKTPILLNMADWDPTFNPVEEAWQSGLREVNLLDKRSKKYPKTTHGFGTRPAQDRPEIWEAHKESWTNTAAFFKETLA